MLSRSTSGGRQGALGAAARLAASKPLLASLLLVLIVVGAVGGFPVLRRALQVVATSSKGTIVIGSDDFTPRIWEDRDTIAPGLAIQRGEAFAISRVGSIRGFKLSLAAYDDEDLPQHRDPAQGARNVRRMIANPALLAMVGPDDAAVASAEIPVASTSSLAMVSPVATTPCLTVNVFCDATGSIPQRLRPTGENNFFRIAANDTFQGSAMADFAYHQLGLRVVAVWDDGKGGVLPADGFAAEFVRDGGEVVARQAFDIDARQLTDFRPWLRDAKAAGAEAIYGGADWLLAGCVARAQSQGILDSTSYYLGPGNADNAIAEFAVSGDSPSDEARCFNDAPDMRNDRIYATLGFGAAELNPEAIPTIDSYARTHSDREPQETATFAGYDCAMIVIAAIGRAIDANGGSKPTREQVRQQIARTRHFHGLTGTFTFDSAGDPTAPTLQVLRTSGGIWAPITNVVAGDEW